MFLKRTGRLKITTTTTNSVKNTPNDWFGSFIRMTPKNWRKPTGSAWRKKGDGESNNTISITLDLPLTYYSSNGISSASATLLTSLASSANPPDPCPMSLDSSQYLVPE